MDDPVVLLHGFTQTGAAWDAVRAHLGDRYVLAPDLRGHGERHSVRPIDTEHLVADVLALAPERFVLGGYSMGGRLALHVAIAAPERVTGLVLVSATAGLEAAAGRHARRASDEEEAAMLGRDGLEAWAQHWERAPLFATAPPQAAAMRRAQDPAGLAASLRGFGTGTMAPVWGRLEMLDMPAAVLAGEHDAKFIALAERMTNALSNATLTIVPGAGHVLPLEAPEAVAAHIKGLTL